MIFEWEDQFFYIKLITIILFENKNKKYFQEVFNLYINNFLY